MTKEELISDVYIQANVKSIVKCDKSVKQIRKELNEYIIKLRDILIKTPKGDMVASGGTSTSNRVR